MTTDQHEIVSFPGSHRLSIWPTADEACAYVADLVTALNETAASDGVSAAVAVPGGNTPLNVFRRLQEQDDNLEALKIFLSDERCVPITDQLSNAGALASASPKLAQKLQLVSAYGAPSASAEQWHGEQSTEIETWLAANDRNEFDLTIVGLGEDGHIASLFPASRQLTASGLVTYIDDAPKAPKERISLTLDFINRSRQIVVLACGSAKRDALICSLGGRSISLPASLLDPNKTTVVCDRAAYPGKRFAGLVPS